MMAPRFLAIIDHNSDRRQAKCQEVEDRTGFRGIYRGTHCSVLANAECPSTLVSSFGVAVGDVFSSTAPESAQPERVPASTPSTAIHELLTDYWGSFAAVMEDTDDGSVSILRDPSAGMPCYVVRSPDVACVSSDIPALILAGLLHPTIDWDQLTTHLGVPNLKTRRTCLHNVDDISPGQHWRITNGNIIGVDEAWSPWNFTAPRIKSADEASALVRAEVRRCVRAWSARYDKILLSVSGGLDSSVVAACLADAGAGARCYTMATNEPAGDERQFAAILANHLGLPLTAHLYQADDIDPSRSITAHLPRPLSQLHLQSRDRVVRELVGQHDIAALMNGLGGDHVFCTMPSATVILDRLIHRGPTIGVLRSVGDICRLTNSTAWDVLSALRRRAVNGPPRRNWHNGGRFLSPVRLSKRSLPTHPWLDAPPSVLPGKRYHVEMLARVQNLIEGYERADNPVSISPLLARPVMELCLSIPTWLWCHGGADRSVARRAFSERLPPAITNRRSKGGPDAFASQVVEKFRSDLARQLCDGLLAEQGLVDVPRLRSILTASRPLTSAEYQPLMMLAEAEAWACSWNRQAERPHEKRASVPIAQVHPA